MHRYLKIATVKEEIRNLTVRQEDRLHHHTNADVFSAAGQPSLDTPIEEKKIIRNVLLN